FAAPVLAAAGDSVSSPPTTASGNAMGRSAFVAFAPRRSRANGSFTAGPPFRFQRRLASCGGCRWGARVAAPPVGGHAQRLNPASGLQRDVYLDFSPSRCASLARAFGDVKR